MAALAYAYLVTPAEIAGLFLSAATLATALGTLVTALKNKSKGEQTHDLVNSMSERNQVLEKESSRLEGFQAGRLRERKRT